jgi:hypothetical protein
VTFAAAGLPRKTKMAVISERPPETAAGAIKA